MEMIERVARAIALADERNGGPPYEYRVGLNKHAKEQLFGEARAAIEAMREPTEAMVSAVTDEGDCYLSFQQMIAAALKC